MKGLKEKFVLILLSTMLLAFVLIYNIWSNYRDLDLLQTDLQNSYDLEISLNTMVSEQSLKKLNEVISQSEENRKTYLEKISQPLEAGKKLPREYQEVLEKNEKQFRDHAQKQVNFLRKKLTYDFVILFSLILMAPFVLGVYLRSYIIKPLKSLATQMRAFIEGKYSYQFTIPPKNEIGGLHQSFNTIAQTVLKQMDDLKALDRAKSEFLSIASHELRTPLTSLKGSLGLLRSGVIESFSPQSLKLIQIAESETDRLIRLINDILDLAKIEARKLPLSLDWESLPELIKKTTTSLEGLAQAAKVKIISELSLNIEAYMDPDRIQQVLTNLISNAIKHSPEGSVVKVITHLDENHILHIEVIDSGKGIAPEDQELIFQKFRQITGPNNPLVKGTGLGLSIAKALVEEHGGQIGLTSQVHQGCRFYFTLPKWRHIQNVQFPEVA